MRACSRCFPGYRGRMVALQEHTKTTRDEKLQEALDRIREERALIDDSFESPPWHEAALREAEEEIKSGRSKFISWEEAMERWNAATAQRLD